MECFSAKDGMYRRVLGADAFTYKLQVESFADVILHGKQQVGANAQDGLACVKAMLAVEQSAKTGEKVKL